MTEHIRLIIFYLAAMVLAVFSYANAEGQETKINLGDVAPGSVRPVKLTAKNADCDAPQDFRVKLSKSPWLRMSGPTVLSGIPAGSSQSSELLMDFSNLSPGRYTGAVAIDCESCGWWIFTACTANDQKVEIEFRVPRPSARNPGRYKDFMDAMNDVAGGNVNIAIGAPAWVEWDEATQRFVIPNGPGRSGYPAQAFKPDDQGRIFNFVNDGVTWMSKTIPYIGEGQSTYPYPPTLIGGNRRYPNKAVFGGFAWEDWQPALDVRYNWDEVESADWNIGASLAYTRENLPANVASTAEQGVAANIHAVILRKPGEFEKDMPGQDLKRLRNTRLECVRKSAAVAAAQTDFTNKTQKADGCVKQLAALKLALDKAKAEQTAADLAAKAAATHAANYESDLAAAMKAARMAKTTMDMQAAAHIMLVREKDAGNPQPSAEAYAKAQVDKAVKAVEDANRATGAVKNSKKTRDRSSRDAARAAKAAARKTGEAQRAYDKQKALCNPLISAAKVAATQLANKIAALNACRVKLDAAEAAAPGQALANLEDKLAKAQGRKRGCQAQMDQYARELGMAFKALRILKVIRPPQEDPKTEKIISDEDEFYFGLYASGAAKATNVATFEVFTVLDTLKAGYGLYKIANSTLIPTSSHFDREGFSKWLTETKGITSNPIEAEAVTKIMEGIINRNGTTDHIRETWLRMQKQCKENDDDIKRLQTRISQTPKR